MIKPDEMEAQCFVFSVFEKKAHLIPTVSEISEPIGFSISQKLSEQIQWNFANIIYDNGKVIISSFNILAYVVYFW